MSTIRTSLQAKAIFQQAILLPAGPERDVCIVRACATDHALRQEVESLVAAHESSGSFLAPPARAALPGLLSAPNAVHRFGDYELLEEIARGGMGIVYKARQLSLNRVVAIKMILAAHFASEAQVKRFRSEAQAAASLNHTNIIGIYEVGEHEGRHYYTMPFVRGKNLAQLVESGGWNPDDGTEAARLMVKVARAVDHAHKAGILHRDLKPGNILIDDLGEPRVTDFGLAKRVKGEANMTQTGLVLGTPSFMAPEEARGRAGQSSPATDIYSLGAVLYYLLTGRPPFVADSALDALLLVVESEAVSPRTINPLVAGGLEHICLRCLEKKPQNRYASAGELADDLERFLKGDALSSNRKAIGRRLETWARRQPALAARICTVLLCLAIVATAFLIKRYTTLPRFGAVIGVLVCWLIVSYVFQRRLASERHARWVRIAWSASDPVALTAILLIAHLSPGFHAGIPHQNAPLFTPEGLLSPLLILYPTLIAASGFWVRVHLVATTTAFSLAGYLVLLLRTSTQAMLIPVHWHILAVVGMIVTGLSVAYLVNRVNALTRFYEGRPPVS